MKKSINLSLSYPSLKLQLRSDEPLECLKELKNILKGLNQNTEMIERLSDDVSNISNPDIIFNLEFSEDIRSNPEIVEQIDKLLQVEEDYHVCKAVFDCKKIVDLDNKHTCFELESDETSSKIKNMMQSVKTNGVNYAVMLLKGEYTENDQSRILDKFKKHLPNARIKVHSIKEPMFGKIAAEVLFFGNI